MNTRYNGWKTYETWVVHLWMTNDEATNAYWTEVARDAFEHEDNTSDAIRGLAARMDGETEDGMPEITGVYADLLNAALTRVEWREIASRFAGDMKEGH
jgi:hypothetical protein